MLIRANRDVTLIGVGDLSEGETVDVSADQWAALVRVGNAHSMLAHGVITEVINDDTPPARRPVPAPPPRARVVVEREPDDGGDS